MTPPMNWKPAGVTVDAGRSTLIVLFSDLVDSTRLRTRLGEEAAEEVRRKHDHLVVDAIETNRGRVIKHLGDGVMATFTGACDAAAAAIKVQQALDRHNRSAPSPVNLEVRVGLSAGDVLVERGDCFGTPVIEAARLCAAARGGQILVTEVVRVLAGSGAVHRFRPVGALDLKGLPAPVPTCEVVWEPALQSPVPAPVLLTDPGRVFVGREVEVGRLRQLWKEAAAGELRLALVSGEPGVGKTRLAAELASEVHEEGATVLAGGATRTWASPSSPSSKPSATSWITRPSRTCPRLGRYGGELVRLVPELDDRVPGLPSPLRSDPETERYRLFDAVASWMAAVAAEVPLFLVLDDLQWAAKPTLLLLRHVVRAPDLERVFVLGTYRDTELGHGHPLLEFLADLRRQAGVERLCLSGLDQGAVIAFMGQAAGQDLDEEDLGLAQAIYQETEGNPFFVREVLRHLTETGALQRRQGRWVSRVPVDELGIPEGVREVVGRRLSRLSDEANRALQRAAVVGTDFELPVVQAAGDLGEEALLQAMEEAIGAHLVVELSGVAPRYRFSHVLVRDTLYRDLSAGRRVAHHRRVATAIEAVHTGRLDDHLPALAHHWARASAPAADTVRAVDYATRAGDRALAQLAHDEAVTYYRQALDLLAAADGPVDEPRRLELLIALGEAQRRAGDPASRATLLEAAHLARVHGDADHLARAALANTRGGYWSSSGAVDDEKVAALEAALAAVGEAPTAVRARLLATLALELVFTPDRARRVRLSDESLHIARAVADAATLAHVQMARAYSINAPDTLAERLAGTAELLTLAAVLGDPLVEFMAHFLRARVTFEAGEVENGTCHFERARALAAELGQPILRWMVGWATVGRLLLAGRVDDADRVTHETFELGRSSGQPDAYPMFLVPRWVIRFEQGRLGELEPELAEVCPRFPAVPGLALMLAATHCQLRRDAEARRGLEQFSTISFELPRDPTWLGFLAVAAEVARHVDDRAAAGVLYDLLRPYPGAFGVLAGVSLGCTDHYLGVLSAMTGRHVEAEEHFRGAAALHEKVRAPCCLARTRLEWAGMLVSRGEPGDAERARERLGQALATARDLGLRSVEQRAAALARSAALNGAGLSPVLASAPGRRPGGLR
jgi:class 3 adenylate cyclase/tetratricopeptide (TPR) repeat protein